MSLRKAINDLLPSEWEYVLRKNKVLTKAISYIYRDAIPDSWKTKYKCKYAVNRIMHLTHNCPFIHCFDANNTIEGFSFWAKIDLEIVQYKESLR